MGETNFEHYKSFLQKAFKEGNNVCVVEGRVRKCGTDICCTQCEFASCMPQKNLFKWGMSEYREPPVDWTKVKKFTPILVSADGKSWHIRLFHRFEYNMVYTYGYTYMIDKGFELCGTPWEYAASAFSDSTAIRLELCGTPWEYAMLLPEEWKVKE